MGSAWRTAWFADRGCHCCVYIVACRVFRRANPKMLPSLGSIVLHFAPSFFSLAPAAVRIDSNPALFILLPLHRGESAASLAKYCKQAWRGAWKDSFWLDFEDGWRRALLHRYNKFGIIVRDEHHGSCINAACDSAWRDKIPSATKGV